MDVMIRVNVHTSNFEAKKFTYSIVYFMRVK